MWLQLKAYYIHVLSIYTLYVYNKPQCEIHDISIGIILRDFNIEYVNC